MSTTGLAAFDSTMQTTNAWLSDIILRTGLRDRHAAYHALRSVLHVLRDRLSVDEAVALGAQLPMLVRGFYYEGWHPAGKPNRSAPRKRLSRTSVSLIRRPPISMWRKSCGPCCKCSPNM